MVRTCNNFECTGSFSKVGTWYTLFFDGAHFVLKVCYNFLSFIYILTIHLIMLIYIGSHCAPIAIPATAANGVSAQTRDGALRASCTCTKGAYADSVPCLFVRAVHRYF